MNNKTVYIVHSVDTEGPLNESLRANFERVQEVFGHDIECSTENLKKLQDRDINLGGDEEKVQRLLFGTRIRTHQTWDQLDKMLDEITSSEYRNQFKDSSDNGWVYNWHCMHHVGFTGINPRRRDIGYHNIFDHYQEYFDKKNDYRDLIQWHYHALSLTNDAHREGCTYLNSDNIFNILSRSIIDRHWFPTVFRAGHNTIRPDSNFFLEQWIPFDFSNSSFDEVETTLSPARFGDWRKAPRSWIPYHPSHDDYQKQGFCRRYVARCLSIDERAYSITYDDVNDAFAEANECGASILSFTNHDFRDMRPDIDRMRKFIRECSDKYPDVDFKFSTAIDAMREVFDMNDVKNIGLTLEIEETKSSTRLIVEAENDIFGPQPYLALKTKTNEYFWQNFDFEEKNKWSYSFDSGNILIDQIEEIGVASNTSYGLTEVVTLKPHSKKLKRTILNK